MPIYEYYCPDCHTVFNFFSRRVNTAARPDCPRCGRPELARQVSLFAISRGRKADDGSMPDLDEDQMERVMTSLAGEIDGMDENDPRQMARVMRRLVDGTGMEMGEGMREAVARLEAGEDPDQVEQNLGDVLEQEDPFRARSGRGLAHDLRRQLLPPQVDETLYDLPGDSP